MKLGLYFVTDQLANGHRIRALTVVNVWMRESLAIEVGQRLRSEHVVSVLNCLTAQPAAADVGIASQTPGHI